MTSCREAEGRGDLSSIVTLFTAGAALRRCCGGGIDVWFGPV